MYTGLYLTVIAQCNILKRSESRRSYIAVKSRDMSLVQGSLVRFVLIYF